jgi:L-ribulokinase
MKKEAYVIGIDYGTDSVRSIIVNAADGAEVAASVFEYPRWKDGLYCEPSENQFRQHPKDYIEGLEYTVKNCLQKAGPAVAANVKAISIDTTGSTPIAVDETGTPLSLLSSFEANPNAMFVLWKDHTSVNDAAEINAHAEKFQPQSQYVVGFILRNGSGQSCCIFYAKTQM